MKVKEDNYFTVQAWMVTKLNLRTVERDVYAIIYGYSQDGESDYHGSLSYLAELTGYSKNSICTALKKLVEKNLIKKTETICNNIKYCSYTSTLDGIQVPCTGIQVPCTNNKINKINNNLSKDKLTKSDTEGTNSFSLGKKKKENKPSLFSQCVNLINEYTQDEQLNKALMDYLRVRLDNKDKPLYSARMWKALLDKLDREFKPSERLQVVYQSIERGYASFFPTDSNYSGSNNKTAKCGEIHPYGHTLEGIPHDGRYDNEDHTRSGLIF